MIDFKEGDVVEVTGLEDLKAVSYNSLIENGLTGRVIEVGDSLVTVEFDEYVGGYKGDGKGNLGYCWHIPKKNLIKFSSEPINNKKEINTREIQILLDDLVENAKQLYFKSIKLAIDKETYKVLYYCLKEKPESINDDEVRDKELVGLATRNEEIRIIADKIREKL